MSMVDNTAAAIEGEAAAVRESAKAAAGGREASEAHWARAARLLFLVAAAILLAAGLIDSVSAWKIGRNLSAAAEAAAKVAISTKLDAKNCGGTPCSIESAAAAAKAYLIDTAYSDAHCIDPRNPSFSGVLVWEFSCESGGPAARPANVCETSDASVCVEIDMTPSKIEPDGKMVGYTRATVQYPHGSALALILRWLPERVRPRMPESVAGSAMLRDPF